MAALYGAVARRALSWRAGATMELDKLDVVPLGVGDGLCPRLGTPKLRAMLVLLLISPSDGL